MKCLIFLVYLSSLVATTTSWIVRPRPSQPEKGNTRSLKTRVFTDVAKNAEYSSTLDEQEHWLDYLKFGGSTPSFDVVEKTKEYTSQPGYRSFNLKTIPPEYYDKDYIFRGPIIGPINRKDLVETNTLFRLDETFPDLDRQTFGFVTDPENPYRCLFFERWIATHTGDIQFNGITLQKATNKKMITPVFPFAITWTPDGKIIYECLTGAVDRFEGNTKGKVAVFGLLEIAGLSIDTNVNNPILSIQQKLLRATNFPAQTYSRPEHVPKWWKSQAVGAEKNDM